MRFINIADDAIAQQKYRSTVSSDDFEFYDESINERASINNREIVNVAISEQNVVARSVANAFVADTTGLAPRKKYHGTEYKI